MILLFCGIHSLPLQHAYFTFLWDTLLAFATCIFYFSVGYTPCLCNMHILLFCGIHSLPLQHAYFPLSVSLNFHLTSGYKKICCQTQSIVSLSLNNSNLIALDPLSTVLRLQERSVYGYQFIRGFLKKDLMSTSKPSSFCLFIGFLVDNF